MRRRSALCVVLALLLAVPIAAAAQSADDEYEISVENSIDTPDRNVTVDGDRYRVTSIARVESGDSATVSVTAPDDAEYDLYLYNSDRQVVATSGESGGTSWTLDSSDYAPGSYVVAVYGSDGRYKAVQSLVFSAYDVRVDAPETLGDGSASTVGVELSSVAGSENVSSVEAVFANNETTRRIEATNAGNGAYEARLPADLPQGEYRLYAVVRGEEGYEGRTELLGISDVRRVTVGQVTGNASGTQTASATAGNATTGDDVVTPDAGGSEEEGTSWTIPDGSPWLLLLFALVGGLAAKVRSRAE